MAEALCGLLNKLEKFLINILKGRILHELLQIAALTITANKRTIKSDSISVPKPSTQSIRCLLILQKNITSLKQREISSKSSRLYIVFDCNQHLLYFPLWAFSEEGKKIKNKTIKNPSQFSAKIPMCKKSKNFYKLPNTDLSIGRIE